MMKQTTVGTKGPPKVTNVDEKILKFDDAFFKSTAENMSFGSKNQ